MRSPRRGPGCHILGNGDCNPVPQGRQPFRGDHFMGTGAKFTGSNTVDGLAARNWCSMPVSVAMRTLRACLLSGAHTSGGEHLTRSSGTMPRKPGRAPRCAAAFAHVEFGVGSLRPAAAGCGRRSACTWYAHAHVDAVPAGDPFDGRRGTGRAGRGSRSSGMDRMTSAALRGAADVDLGFDRGGGVDRRPRRRRFRAPRPDASA